MDVAAVQSLQERLRARQFVRALPPELQRRLALCGWARTEVNAPVLRTFSLDQREVLQRHQVLALDDLEHLTGYGREVARAAAEMSDDADLADVHADADAADAKLVLITERAERLRRLVC